MLGMILAGGGGTRLWPLSRLTHPKQFLNLGSSSQSLLQATYRRIHALVAHEDIFIVASRPHEGELLRQIEEIAPQFPKQNLLLEPSGRNTAPAILWLLFCLPEARRNEPLMILPADHLIPDTEAFAQCLNQAIPLAMHNKIVTFGIEPLHPETGYGYIKCGAPLSVGYRVERFVEKPDLQTALRYVESGEYTWNAGIFMSTPQTLLEEYQTHAPQLVALFEQPPHARNDSRKAQRIEKIYQQLPSDSFDCAILEKSQKVAVLPMKLAWSDLGSWESLHLASQKDENNNVLRGNTLVQDTHNCLIFSTKKLVTSIGVKNLVIVETEDALLVCNLSASQEVKKLVETLKAQARPEYHSHTTQTENWGTLHTLHQAPPCTIQQVEILPGKKFTARPPSQWGQHWTILQGEAEIWQEGEVCLLSAHESIYLPPLIQPHITNKKDTPLQLVVIQQSMPAPPP